MNIVALYASNLKKPATMLDPIRARLREQARRLGLRLLSVTPRALDGFEYVHQPVDWKMPSAIYETWLAGTDALAPNDLVYVIDDDCLYVDEHFEEGERLATWPQPCACYDLNMVFLCRDGYFERHRRGSISNGMLWAQAAVLRYCARRKLAEIESGDFNCYEPAGGQGYPTADRRLPVACIDVRTEHNNTWKYNPAADKTLQSEPGWPDAVAMIREYGIP